ncbi:hypothetical protein VNO77_34504 [Canavalia gladiata]|uniref:Uncharacterized protein n=1 Tax=Canavalia gladiata TaxID=3824 RepID=A0AAN9KGV1_CANGL
MKLHHPPAVVINSPFTGYHPSRCLFSLSFTNTTILIIYPHNELSDEENDGGDVNELEWKNLDDTVDDSDGDDDNAADGDEHRMVSFDGGVGGSSFHVPSSSHGTFVQRRDQSGRV